MAKLYDRVEGRLRTFVERQRVFFVATAPLADDGHVNLSPRGVPGTFGMLDDRTFAWVDTTGSGSETIAHLRENGRITIMFCAFEGPPNIVRFHGRGRVVTIYDQEYDELAARFEELPGTRAVVVVDIDRISDSCGYGVPLMEYVGERNLLQPYFTRKGVEGSADYRRRRNRTSIDGLPAFDFDPMDEWSTLAGLARIRERLSAQIDGWTPPVGHGIALDGEFGHVNRPGGTHGLPAVLLATVLKHDGSTATIEMSRQQLDEAITALAPAAACTEVDHPNLAAWRTVREQLEERGGGTVAAVFVRSAQDPPSSDVDARLRALW
ncbi:MULTISPECIES: pyridoxamine 5'-phosphate oxidase family protein [Nocardioides]|uniref:Pyridoxamine 5'-phosphate oxidase family protein n=1 Tax=Nocardioides vastitatis TaxID=2568655 RepID=A0ABW0ZF64_9ACTN|nr:pyridoxamine 5'-phosphate oxidase family protein [Nocardioides sp.]THJ00001.1 pyridoxamine 5'-phosphate oxidase family protein [Nocardioides sp.]